MTDNELADQIEEALADQRVEGLEKFSIYGHREDWKRVMEVLRTRPEESGWRDPKDKPPHLPGENHSEDVLLSMKRRGIYGDDHGIRIGHVSCGHWRPAGGNGDFDDDVLGWKPLPEPVRAPQPRNIEAKP